MNYILDTCFFIDTKRDHLPLEQYPQFWSWLIDLAKQKRISIPQQVVEELAAGNDALATWVKANKATLVNGDPGFAHISRVMTEGYGAVDETTLEQLKADPWIIASAAAMSGTVVTSEKGGNQTAPRRKKILSVCETLGIRHMTITAFLWEMRASMSA